MDEVKRNGSIKSDMSLYELRGANITRQQEWQGGERADLCFRGLEMAGESGELANKIKKLVRLDKSIMGTMEARNQLIEQIKEEMGDVLITLDLIGMELGISLADATRAKFNKTSKKHGYNTTLGD